MALLNEECKKKEEEQKLIKGKFIILINARIEFYEKGKKSGERPIRRELLVDATQRIAFEKRGDGLQNWVSANYPGGIAKNITVVNKGQCSIKDYYRLKGL